MEIKTILSHDIFRLDLLTKYFIRLHSSEKKKKMEKLEKFLWKICLVE